jgi:serine protease Do
MKKLIAAFVVLCSFTLSVGQTSYTGYSWPRSLVRDCIQRTSVLFGQSDKHEWLGSGVIISKDGLVLTAAHVVDDANLKALKMVTWNGNEYDVKVLLVNKRLDLALVQPKASAESFNYAPIQESNDLWVGEDILVVGHPLGHMWTVTDGIIGSLPWSVWYFNRIIETNARILPGNSGGPVFSRKGEVIGIVSAMYVDHMGLPSGIGIVIPIDGIHHILKMYKEGLQFHPVKRYKISDLN